MAFIINYFFPSLKQDDEFVIVNNHVRLNDIRSIKMMLRKVQKPIVIKKKKKLDLSNQFQHHMKITDLINIQLKKTKINEKPEFYPPRHPVVNEMYHKFNNRTLINQPLPRSVY
jgi:hypothetical protein